MVRQGGRSTNMRLDRRCDIKYFKKVGRMIKRILDVGLSLVGIILFIPLWIVIPLFIYLEDGKPILFVDYRVGKNQKIYKHFKFRSMVKAAESEIGPVWSSQDDTRVTKTGRLLRATAMDELPQVLNILQGDMSFVGPRPERPFFVDKFIKNTPDYEKRFSVKPGLTGIAQVYGKYNTPAEKKLEYDHEYIRKMNTCLDVWLICLSVFITLKGGWSKFESCHNKGR